MMSLPAERTRSQLARALASCSPSTLILRFCVSISSGSTSATCCRARFSSSTWASPLAVRAFSWARAAATLASASSFSSRRSRWLSKTTSTWPARTVSPSWTCTSAMRSGPGMPRDRTPPSGSICPRPDTSVRGGGGPGWIGAGFCSVVKYHHRAAPPAARARRTTTKRSVFPERLRVGFIVPGPRWGRFSTCLCFLAAAQSVAAVWGTLCVPARPATGRGASNNHRAHAPRGHQRTGCLPRCPGLPVSHGAG